MHADVALARNRLRPAMIIVDGRVADDDAIAEKTSACRRDAAIPQVLDLLCFATQGAGSADEQRLSHLLKPLRPRFLAVDRRHKQRLPLDLLRAIERRRPDVIVVEGTGAAGGVGVMSARLLKKVPYIVSSGDAVEPYLRAFHRRVGLAAKVYEHSLYRLSAGFIGWSPYLVGRALSIGAPRGMTAAHFSLGEVSPRARETIREKLGIPPEAIVIGVAGRILVDPRQGYCYGVELVRALRRTDRADLRVLIVGDGDGLPTLAQLAGEELGRRVLLAGWVRPAQTLDYLAAMDVGALSQSTDLIGALRYTAKLPSYLAAGVPVLATEVPLAYDLDEDWIWRLPGDSQWDEVHVQALADFMQRISREDVMAKKSRLPDALATFDSLRQQQRVCAFVREATARAYRPDRAF